MAARHPQLVEYLKAHSLQLGEFRLSSGRASNYYIDGKMASFDPQGNALVVEAILDEIKGLDLDAIGGMDMGATPLAGALANRSYHLGRPLPTFTVRKDVKEHGTMKKIEGPLHPNSRVVIVDDVVTTGKSIVQAIDAVEAIGCRVVLAISIVDRDAGARQQLDARGIAYQPLVTLADLGVAAGAETEHAEGRSGRKVGAG